MSRGVAHGEGLCFGYARELALYTSEPFGQNNQKVSGPSLSGNGVETQTGNVESVKWSPDGSLLAYLNDQDTAFRTELYTVAPDGSFNMKVNGPIQPGGTLSIYFDWQPANGLVPCDVTEVTCPSGWSCYPTSSGDWCLPTGTVAEGDVCSLVNDCAGGLGCVSVPTSGDTYCRALCDESMNVYCTNLDPCVPLSGASALSACLLDTCDALTNPSCIAGAACYPTVDYGDVCWYAGTGAQDDPCTDFRDCAAGLTCIDISGPGTGLCLEICDPLSPVCPSGYGCSGVSGETYGVCYQP